MKSTFFIFLYRHEFYIKIQYAIWKQFLASKKLVYSSFVHEVFFCNFHAKRKHLETFISFYISMCVNVIAYLELE